MPSKKIYIKRTQPFKHEFIGSEAMQEQLSYTKRGVGSYYASKGSVKKGSGLTPQEERLLLPLLFNMEAPGTTGNNQEYHDKVSNYYTEINTDVPHGKLGRELEVGLEDNNQPLSAQNLPINLEDYIRYRHALKHPFAAASPEEAAGNQLVWFYIEDPELVDKANLATLEKADEALSDYTQMKDDEKKCIRMVALMRAYIKKEPGRPPININNLTSGQRILILRQLAIEKPEKFHELATDQELGKRYFIDELLGAGILQRIGNSIIDKEGNFNLGDTVKEVMVNLWNAKESNRLMRFKAELEKIKSGNKVLVE